MVKKDKRIDNPLFENTTASRGVAIKTKRSRRREKKGDDDALSRIKDVKEPVVETPQAEKPAAPAEKEKSEISSEKPDTGKSVDELMKIKDNLKGRLAKMEKESEDLAEVHKRFVFVNRFEESAEVEELESDGDVVAEWGKIDSAEEGEEPAVDGKGDIFHVIRELEQELDTTSVLNKSLEVDLSETRRDLNKQRAVNDDFKNRIRSLDESAKLSEELLEKLALSEEEKNKALKRKADIETELEYIISEKRNIESSLYEAKIKIKDSQKIIEGLENESSLIREKNRLLEEIQNDLTYTVARKDKDLERLQALESELEAVTTSKDAVDLELKTSAKIINNLKKENESIETRRSYLEEENRRLKDKLDAVIEENERSNERVQALARELGATRATKNNLESECGILRKTIEDIHGALVYTKQKAFRRQGAKADNPNKE